MAGGHRIARAAGAAALSTLAALTMHVVAGGHTPAAAGVLVPLALSFAVGVQLAGRPLGRVRLAALIGASQLAFHVAFSLGATAAPEVHAHHGDVALGPLAVADHAGSMPLAHAAAAAITYAVIRRADSLIAALGRWGELVAHALLARLALGAPAAVPCRPFRARAVVVPAVHGRLAVSTPATRGPPGIA